MRSSQAFKGVLALLAGLALPLAFSPFKFWPLTLVCLGLFYRLLDDTSPRVGLLHGFLFGLGYFGLGASWIFVSMHRFGQLGTALALLMTLLFVCYLALYPAAVAYALRKWFSHSSGWISMVAFSLLWVLSEFLRGSGLSGFPWLILAHAQVDSPLAAWAPLLGELGLSGVCVLSAVVLASLNGRDFAWRLLAGGLLLIWLLSGPLASIEWTKPKPEAHTISLVQGNIPQDLKWLSVYRDDIIARYQDLTELHLGSDVIVWPEAALPAIYDEVESLVEAFGQQAGQAGSHLLLGILVYDAERNTHYNSIHVANTEQFYFKRRLVPFGETLPFAKWVGPIIDLFRLPYSDIQPAVNGPVTLSLLDDLILGSVCYEIAFGRLMRAQSAESHYLLNVSNDTWFGDSIGPHQHLQIARYRALELGKELARATNNGITAVIDSHGQVRGRAPQFEAIVLNSHIVPREGSTPYSRWGDWPFVCVFIMGTAICAWRSRTGPRP